MLTEQTVERPRSLRLGAIADTYLAQQRDPSTGSLSFDERLGMLAEPGVWSTLCTGHPESPFWRPLVTCVTEC
jgi:hypothetical protein